MRQQGPCPKCGKLIGWRQYLPGVQIVHASDGLIRQQRRIATDNERKWCAHCGFDITKLVK